MTQNERRIFLIEYLLKENPGYHDVQIPDDENEQKRLLRSLMNVRPPEPASEGFLRIQDEYLQEAGRERGITDFADLRPVTGQGGGNMYLWQGDITTLKVDAIVNAANSGMTGCWQPCHACIDNCIHTFSGIQLRAVCADIMQKQGHEEPTGSAKITPAFNLPCKYVIHTVGPIVQGRLQKKHEEQLASCYRSCLELAEQHKVRSIAFCCISTGVFMFPNERAAEIAAETVRKYFEQTESGMKVVFDVFNDEDFAIYSEILS
ncbi:protein-ADP-ribose hydrolase [Treponema sp. Marseille-Q4130]|uniref:protein-ADP-ribose hydrolase n=1 Tax=Treponema sp. Marseille-Q4130 TaxID=2766702 RepID=UPI00165287BD|nr:protein-ADP-ribose hydrolase [Treponema sp. Marseille-Q4130]MBC6720460.1 protein-ADP-ribose hydrolase [Treponema sp. Marseille-Q4130]